MGQFGADAADETSTLEYEADLCGNIEQALKGLQGYGIMALELIQNADDAQASTLTFDSRSDALVVRNDAEFSSCGLLKGRCTWERAGDPRGIRRPCNFHAISRMGSRSKIGAPDQIGRFGIGFVSVYQVTDTPIVRSADIQLTLNPLSGKGAVARVAVIKGTEFELPWAAETSDIRAELHAAPTPPDVAASAAAEIADTLRSSLLFLRHLRKVEVRENGQLMLAVDIERDRELVTLDFGPAGRDRWLVLSGDATDEIESRDLPAKFEVLQDLKRNRTVSVAIPVETAQIEGRLFAYLPTQHPTHLPLHINADFFPHASRQDIVLKGEGHERYWNEALIGTAAGVIGANFTRLREALGPTRLWELGSAALKLRGHGPFAQFWTEFAPAAKANASVWTTDLAWHSPEGAFLAPEGMPPAELAAIAGLGISLIDETLRPHFTAMSTVGARELVLSTATAVLEERQGTDVSTDNPRLYALWSAVERLIGVSTGRPGFPAVLARLKAATFLVDVDGRAASPDELWRLPTGIRPQAVRRYLTDCPIAHDDVASAPGIAALIDEMALGDLTASLAAVVTSAADALKVIGPEPSDARGLYSLLTAFPEDGATAAESLANTPILRTRQGFVPPSRAQLPGHFRDPTGYFELIDTTLFPPGMDEFARETLGVDVLSFHKYIDEHLPTILQRNPTREQYRDIIAQIVTRKNELDDRGSLERLRGRSFVRTRAGTYARPGNCYFWTAPLATILGDDPANWVDSSWMPPSPIAPQLQDLLEARLGMPVTVTPRHIVDRLEALAIDGTPDEVADRVTPVVRHVIERWSRFGEDDLDVFRELQDLQFLPAVVNGARDPENTYLPGDVYRAGRARGFASQVAVIDLTPLRATTLVVGEFLDLLDVPEEPETSVVVAQLQHCVSTGTAPSDLTYAILNERVEAEDDIDSIMTLEGSRFIYDPNLERFMGADEVFWLPPPFRDYWWRASDRMGQRPGLFKLLGVKEEPDVADHVALMLRIAARADLTVGDIETHARCVARVCDAIDAGETGLADALEALRSDSSLLTVDGDPIWPEDAVWLDSELLAEPFGTALNRYLVAPPDAPRTSAARLYRHLSVQSLSEIARLRLAEEPEGRSAEEDTDLLRERADLILWVAPNPASRSALRTMLRDIEVRHTETLRIQAEITTFDPPVTSPISDVPAFYEAGTGVLHVAGTQARTNWSAAFRRMFAEIEELAPLTDIKPLVTTATLIMLSANRELAEHTLSEAGYRAPATEDDIASGEALGDGKEVDEDFDEREHLAEDDYAEPADEEDDASAAGATEADGAGKLGGDREQEVQVAQSSDVGEPGTNGGKRGASGGDSGEEYRSKVGTGGIGESEPKGEPSSRPGVGGHQSGTKGHGHGADGSRERRARTSRMRSYVAREGDRGSDDSASTGGDDEIIALIDLAAIKAVIKYEEQRGWRPEEQPHNNPGYDIVSHGPTGERRLIEVKGLEKDWTERGVKLSHVQFGMAQKHPEEYWIYVVERARELGHLRVNAIGNPFQKVDEYWFDDAWRALADEGASAHKLNVTAGAKVRHQLWGKGRIIDVQSAGIMTKVKVDFGFEGVKFIPFNSSLELVED